MLGRSWLRRLVVLPSDLATSAPIIAADIWANGSRSPDAPTEPWQGTTGVRPLASIASSIKGIANRCVYGLTKGQFSATADLGSKLKTGVVNDLPAIDLCAMAIELGCGYVARSFSGDMKQLVALLKGALAHRGTALLDVISPCVTFNDHEGSTKSYAYTRENNVEVVQGSDAEKEGLVPGPQHDLSALRAILSTGSPLAAHSFDFVYDRVKRDVRLSSISGGPTKRKYGPRSLT